MECLSLSDTFIQGNLFCFTPPTTFKCCLLCKHIQLSLKISIRKSGHVQNSPAIKIHPRSKSTQSNLGTAYKSKVRVRGNSDNEK